MKDVAITFTVNGDRHALAVPVWETLLECLRERLGLLGTKKSCDVQVCGACTVLVDDRPVSACTFLAFEARDRHVRTIEGLAQGPDGLDPVQQAFVEHGGLQCGACTPGQIMAARALLDQVERPTVEQVKEWMTGNLCRCTGYYKIVESVLAAADDHR